MRDTAKFEAWALQATPKLFRQARLLVGDWHLAEDLAQDTIAKMYVHWARVDSDLSPDGYALRTLFHLFVSRRRLESSGEIATDLIPETFDGATIDVEIRHDLARALATLKPLERAVVVARYLDDRPVASVAALLDRSEGWVRTTSSRALARLRVSPLLAPLAALT